MSDITVLLKLPESVLTHFRRLALAQQRKLEDVLLETLIVQQPTEASYEPLLAPLADYTDAQLWDMANASLTPSEAHAHRMLADKLRREDSTADEYKTLDHLVDKLEVQRIFRARALQLLAARGYTTS